MPNIIPKIGCEIIMKSIQLVIEVGAAAVPGVGEAVDGGMSKAPIPMEEPLLNLMNALPLCSHAN